jgi:hypothetical protein
MMTVLSFPTLFVGNNRGSKIQDETGHYKEQTI